MTAPMGEHLTRCTSGEAALTRDSHRLQGFRAEIYLWLGLTS